jgi:hypothetical protein
MRKGIGIGLIAAGVALVIVGARADGTSQMVAVFGGFVLSITGVVSLFGGRGDSLETGTGAVTETDTPARVRLLGVFVTLASLGLPYIQLPLGGGGERYSFVGILMGLNSDTITLQALSAGNDLAGGLTLLIFASVVIAGAFASILHHLGGYVVLFGAAGYGYVVSEVTEAAPLQVILSEFRIGLYVAVVGALIIVASSFFSYQTAEKDRSWYGGGR